MLHTRATIACLTAVCCFGAITTSASAAIKKGELINNKGSELKSFTGSTGKVKTEGKKAG